MRPNETQPGLFDEDSGRRGRDLGTDRVTAAQDRDDGGAWRARAETALQSLAAAGGEFNADDVRKLAGSPARPNAMGAVFLWAVNRGLVRRVGYRARRAENAHAQRIAVYTGTGGNR